MDETIHAESDSTITDQGAETTTAVSAENSGEPQKGKSNVSKLLAQRNEARKINEQLTNQLSELQGKKDSMNPDLIQKMVDQKIADMNEQNAITNLETNQKIDRQNFLMSNPEAKEYVSDVETIMDEHPTLSHDDAHKFYLVHNNPQMLMDEQKRNQLFDNKGSVEGATPESLYKSKSMDDMNLSDLRALAEEEVKTNWI